MAAAAALAPRAASSQRPAEARRVGLLMTTTPTAAAHIVVAFVAGLRELGHVEGKNVRFEYRWAENHPERFAEMAADLVRQPVDVLVASSQAAALAAQRATTTIPIVMVNAGDLVEAGLVASLARPGGNVTGLSQQLAREIRAKQLQLLKQTPPRMSRVAVLHSVATTVGLREYEAAGQTLAVRVQVVDIRNRGTLEQAFAAMAAERIDALLVPADPFLFTERKRVAGLAREHRLPGMYSTREYTEAGGLMSYSARLTEEFRCAAVYVDRTKRIGALANPEDPLESAMVAEAEEAARSLGVQLEVVEASAPTALESAFSTMHSDRADAVLVLGGGAFYLDRRHIVDLVLRNHLPSVFQNREFVAVGGLLSYAPSTTANYRRAVFFVDKILKGSKAADPGRAAHQVRVGDQPRCFSLFEDVSGWYGSGTGADELWLSRKPLPLRPRHGRVFPCVRSNETPSSRADGACRASRIRSGCDGNGRGAAIQPASTAWASDTPAVSAASVNKP